MNAIVSQAFSLCPRTILDKGSDAVLDHDGQAFDALLSPPNAGQRCQITAQAGYRHINMPASIHSEIGMPWGFGFVEIAPSEASPPRHASCCGVFPDDE